MTYSCRRRLPIPNSDRLGEMKLDNEAKDAYFLSNGFYRFNGVWKLRGVGYDHEKRVEVENTLVREGKDGQLYIGLRTTKTIHLRTGIHYKLKGKIEIHSKITHEDLFTTPEQHSRLSLAYAPRVAHVVAEVASQKELV